MTTVTRQLEQKHGGSWLYDRAGSRWCCDDGRYVVRVHTGGVDVNGEAAPGWGYFLYDSSGNGKRIFLK